LERKISDCCH
jgi:hypothetical protein